MQSVFKKLTDKELKELEVALQNEKVTRLMIDAPSIDIVKCKECKHRPIKEDENGENYGFNLIKPNGNDSICPCLVEDGWYSWMPNDNFYCGYGERENDE